MSTLRKITRPPAQRGSRQVLRNALYGLRDARADTHAGNIAAADALRLRALGVARADAVLAALSEFPPRQPIRATTTGCRW